ncbi:MAG: DUF1501 domain-containing protein [Planctomycetia bacterium]
MQPTRRDILRTTANGFGYLAFAALATRHASQTQATAAGPLAVKPAHFPARAKHVIFLCMQGGPSHVDTFDHKPRLAADAGKPAPAAAGRNGQATLLPSPWKFTRRGRSGLWISELFDEVARHADDLCVINSMATDLPAHPQAFAQMHTGTTQFIRPSLGAWTLYGLGTENENLPGFITINPPANAARTFGSAFLPAIYQGTRIGGNRLPGGFGRRQGAEPAVADIVNDTFGRDAQRDQIDLIQSLNRSRLALDGGTSPEVEGVIESYELAFRMQSEVPGVMDLAREDRATLDRYGIGEAATDGFGRQCLLARRFVEAGVRFIEITHGPWDHHFGLGTALPATCRQVDRPIAALLDDLKQRDLLDETLVVWGGEFGRTPHSQGRDGRDHNNKGFTLWMAGGGVKGGHVHGATDDFGYEAVDKRMHVHDWHATLLHQLGLDHERLPLRHAVRDFLLTDVHGEVAREILA